MAAHSKTVALLIEYRYEVLQDVSRRAAISTFRGHGTPEIARAYVAADCLMLPSDVRETWGLVVNEAVTCSFPAIVGDHVRGHVESRYSIEMTVRGTLHALRSVVPSTRPEREAAAC